MIVSRGGARHPAQKPSAIHPQVSGRDREIQFAAGSRSGLYMNSMRMPLSSRVTPSRATTPGSPAATTPNLTSRCRARTFSEPSHARCEAVSSRAVCAAV
jgi:hypothetical protein